MLLTSPARLQAVATIICALLAGCASPSSSSFLEKVTGERVYGMVVAIRDIPLVDVLAGPACIRRDIACALALEAKEGQYASVAVHGGNVISKVQVPRNMNFAPGDILQVEVSANPARLPEFTAMGARSHQRGPDCDWMDGSVAARRGGVVCFGWSYKQLL
jgi:hypothetical protein